MIERREMGADSESSQLDCLVSADGRDTDNACLVAMMWQYATPGKQWEIITNENR